MQCLLHTFFGRYSRGEEEVESDITEQANNLFHPVGLRKAQFELGIYSKGSYSVEYTDKMSVCDFLNDYLIFRYMREVDRQYEIEASKT